MALILGHSQAKYFGDNISDLDTTSLYFSGAKIDQLLQHDIVHDCVENVQTVAVICGINDVYHRPTLHPVHLINKFEELFNGIRGINPNATVILSAILPVARNMFGTGVHHDQATIEKINITQKTNDGLRTVSMVTPGLHFVDHHDFFTNESRALLSKDGLHLSVQGTKLVVQNIEERIKFVNSIRVESYSDVVKSVIPVCSEHHTHDLQSHTSTYTNGKHSVTAPSRKTTKERVHDRAHREQRTRHTGRHVKQSPNTATHKRKPNNKRPTISTHVSSNIFTLLRVDKTKDYSDVCDRDSVCNRNNDKRDNIRQTRREESRKRQVGGGDPIAEELSDESPETTTTTTTTTNIESEHQSAIKYSSTDRNLKLGEALDILMYPEESGVTEHPPFRPESGPIYVYSDGGDNTKVEDWRCDGYTWRNYGKKLMEFNGKIVEKCFFRTHVPPHHVTQ